MDLETGAAATGELETRLAEAIRAFLRQAYEDYDRDDYRNLSRALASDLLPIISPPTRRGLMDLETRLIAVVQYVLIDLGYPCDRPKIRDQVTRALLPIIEAWHEDETRRAVRDALDTTRQEVIDRASDVYAALSIITDHLERAS